MCVSVHFRMNNLQVSVLELRRSFIYYYIIGMYSVELCTQVCTYNLKPLAYIGHRSRDSYPLSKLRESTMSTFVSVGLCS